LGGAGSRQQFGAVMRFGKFCRVRFVWPFCQFARHFFDIRFKPASLESSGFAGIVGTASFLAAAAFVVVKSRRSKGGAMKTSHSFVGVTCNALSSVACAVLAHISASALLAQTGYPVVTVRVAPSN
jgi:hypothetical protein